MSCWFVYEKKKRLFQKSLLKGLGLDFQYVFLNLRLSLSFSFLRDIFRIIRHNLHLFKDFFFLRSLSSSFFLPSRLVLFELSHVTFWRQMPFTFRKSYNLLQSHNLPFLIIPEKKQILTSLCFWQLPSSNEEYRLSCNMIRLQK